MKKKTPEYVSIIECTCKQTAPKIVVTGFKMGNPTTISKHESSDPPPAFIKKKKNVRQNEASAIVIFYVKYGIRYDNFSHKLHVLFSKDKAPISTG